MTKSILICGVGGQGILLAADILSETALEAGNDVKKSEIHGMAQRGGAVTSAVRFGEKVYSPRIGKGEADILLAFEKLEALRNLASLKQGGVCIVNDYELPPLSVASGNEKYPENIYEIIKKTSEELVVLPAFKLAKELGNSKVVNTILTGALAKKLDFPKDKWLEIIKKNVKPKFLDINLKAFEIGYSF